MYRQTSWLIHLTPNRIKSILQTISCWFTKWILRTCSIADFSSHNTIPSLLLWTIYKMTGIEFHFSNRYRHTLIIRLFYPYLISIVRLVIRKHNSNTTLRFCEYVPIIHLSQHITFFFRNHSNNLKSLWMLMRIIDSSS